MRINNNAGYTLMEMIIVLSITSTILLFFTHSLMNNFRFIHKYQKNSSSFTKIKVMNRIKKDFERSGKAEIEDNKLNMDVAFLEEENKYSIRKVSYEVFSNLLVRREIGENETSNHIDMGDLSMKMDWEIISNSSNLLLTYTDTNGQTDTYNLGVSPR